MSVFREVLTFFGRRSKQNNLARGARFLHHLCRSCCADNRCRRNQIVAAGVANTWQGIYNVLLVTIFMITVLYAGYLGTIFGIERNDWAGTTAVILSNPRRLYAMSGLRDSPAGLCTHIRSKSLVGNEFLQRQLGMVVDLLIDGPKAVCERVNGVVDIVQ